MSSQVTILDGTHYHFFHTETVSADNIQPHLACDDDVKVAWSDFLKELSKEFYAEGIQKLISRWQKCVTLNGD